MSDIAYPTDRANAALFEQADDEINANLGQQVTILQPTHRGMCQMLIGMALARPDYCIYGWTVSLPMHHWLTEHGMAPGVDTDTDRPLWTVWDEEAALTAVGAERLPIRKCRVCGCTEAFACPQGCWWVEADLCSTCADRGESDGTDVL